MFDILVNGQLVAVAAEGVVKLFVNALVSALPTEVNITTKKHQDPEAVASDAKAEKK